MEGERELLYDLDERRYQRGRRLGLPGPAASSGEHPLPRCLLAWRDRRGIARPRLWASTKAAGAGEEDAHDRFQEYFHR